MDWQHTTGIAFLVFSIGLLLRALAVLAPRLTEIGDGWARRKMQTERARAETSLVEAQAKLAEAEARKHDIELRRLGEQTTKTQIDNFRGYFESKMEQLETKLLAAEERERAALQLASELRRQVQDRDAMIADLTERITGLQAALENMKRMLDAQRADYEDRLRELRSALGIGPESRQSEHVDQPFKKGS